MDRYTKKPIDSVSVWLYKGRSSSAWINPNEYGIYSNNTDEDGNYEIRFSARKNRNYFLRISEETDDVYFTEEFNIEERERVYHDFFLVPKSSFTLKIKNVSPVDANDKINIGIRALGLYPSGHILKGKFIDTTFTYDNIGGTAIFSWRVIKDSIEINNQDSIECPPDKYNEYIILY